VAESDEQQHGHAACEEAGAVPLQDEREAHAEEQGEEGVELAVYDQVLQVAHHLVDRCRG